MSKFVRALLFALAGTLFVATASAQSILSGGSGGALDSVTVEADVVRARALDAFETTLDQRLVLARERLLKEGQSPAKAAAQAKLVLSGFSGALDELIPELRGDGIMDAGEATSRIGEAREQYLTEFDEAIDALADGAEAPPRRRLYDSDFEYSKDLASYALLERNSLRDWAQLVGALIAAVLVAWLVKKLLDAIETRFRRHDADLWANTFDSFDGPLYTLAIVTGLMVALSWLWIPGIATDSIFSGLQLLLMLALGWLLWSLCSPAAHAMASLFKRTYANQIDNHFAVIIRRILRVLVLLAVLMLIANTLAGAAGIGGFLAGLGLLGVALALVLKGTLDNIVSSFTVFADKPFKIGDLLDHDGQWGHVEDIGFRSTKLRTLTGHLLTIPNSILLDTTVDNVSERPFIRRRFRLGLVYGTSAEKIEEAISILKDLLANHDSEPDDEPPRVYFEAFGDYQLQLFVQYCYEPPNFWEALAFDSKINHDILRRFNEAEIEFAFPTQTTLLKADHDDLPLRRAPGGEASADAG